MVEIASRVITAAPERELTNDVPEQPRIGLPLLAVAEVDFDRARALNIPAEIVRFSASGDEFVLEAVGRKIAPDTAYMDLIGFVALSSPGIEAASAFRDRWNETFCDTPPETLDLSTVAAAKSNDALLRWMVGRISASRAQAAERKVVLMRDLSELRQIHELGQSAFLRLEALFQSTFHSARALDVFLKDNPAQPSCTVGGGKRIAQRLPCDSVGLCDVSVFIAGASATETGQLHARLTLSESGEVVAEWVIDGSEIHAGWLRLSLETALSVDPQTPVLELEWTGQAPLSLASSFPHPDPRFQPRPEAPVLAMQVWRFVPDTAAAFPADGHICHNTGSIRRWNIGRSYQTTAESLARPPGLVKFSKALGGLLVRPRGRAVSAARLTRAGRVGMTQIMASVETKQAEGPRIQYAIGVAPNKARPWFGRAVPRFQPGMATEWYELGPSEWTQLHLYLPQAIEEVSDIYLMTRLAPGQRASEPPAACFFEIIGSVQ